MKLVPKAPSLALVGAFLLAGCAPDGLGRSNPNFLIVGHHGSPNLAPENTIPSFEVATVLGANGIELDLCITKDGTLVALHDCNPDDTIALARQTGREGFNWLPDVPSLGSPWRRPSNELTLAELREYYGYRRFDGLRDPSAVIPTFAEVLAWISTEPRVKAIYVDLKFGPSETAPARQALREVWAALGGTGGADAGVDAGSQYLRSVRFYFLDVHREIVDALVDEQRAIAADPLRIVLDYEGSGALGATLGAGLRDITVGLTPTFTWSDYKAEIAEMVDAREHHKIDSVLAWTFDRERQLAELLYYSVDGIITNDVSTLRRMWQETLE